MRPESAELPEALRTRFVIEEELGRGASAVVYRAREREDGREVALKVLLRRAGFRDADAEARHRFVHEAKLLSRLEHPGIVAVRGYGFFEPGGAYVVMDRRPGRLLREVIADGPLTPSAVERLGRDLALALDHAHTARVLHRDIKPSNIMIGPGGAASLIDFGLATSIAPGVRPEVCGTYAYMAPEQVGVLSRTVDARADLYALGVVLYRALTGRLPFKAETLRRLVHLHLAKEPDPIKDIRPDAPRALAAIVHKLLRKEPSERYQSASSLARDLEEVGRLSLELEVKREPEVLDRAAGGVRLREDPPLIGRDTELGQLVTSIDRAAAGEGGVVVIRGPRGAGRRRLLEEVQSDVRLREGACLHARAADGGQPFGPVIVGVQGHLRRLASGEPKRFARLRDRIAPALSGWADGVLRVLPELEADGARVDSGALFRPGDDAHLLTHQRVEGWVRLLAELSREARPLVMLIEGLDRADEPTVRLVERLARRGDDHGVVCVASVDRDTPGAARELLEVRSGGSSHGGLLQRLEVVDLAPVSSLLARELLCGLLQSLGRPEEALTQWVLEEAGRWPGAIVRTVRELFAQGALALTPGQDERGERKVQLSEAARSEAPRSEGALASSLLWSPVARLEGTLAEAFGRLMVPRGTYSFELACAALDAYPGAALELIDPLRAAGLIERVPRLGYRARSGEVRREVLAALPRAERREASARIAQHLLEREGEGLARSPFELAYHQIESGQGGAAVPHLVEAGREALAASAYREAREAFASALDQLGFVSERDIDLTAAREGLLLRANTGLGDAEAALGRYGRSGDAYDRALAHARDPLARARVKVRIGAAAIRAGDTDQALTALGEALPLLGLGRLPRGRTASKLRLGAALAARSLRERRGSRFDAEAGPPAPQLEEALSVTIELSQALYFVNTARSVLVHLRALAAAERCGPSPAVGRTFAAHSVCCALLGWHEASAVWAERALAIGRVLGDERVLGDARKQQGLASYLGGRYEAAREAFAQAETIFERRYDPFSLNLIRTYLGQLYFRRGDLGDAKHVFAALQKAGERAGDLRSRAVARAGLGAIACLHGQSEHGYQALRRARETLTGLGDQVSLTLCELWAGEAYLRAGDAARALTLLAAASERATQGDLRTDTVPEVHAALAEALVFEDAGWAAASSTSRRERLQRARRLIARARKLLGLFPGAGPRVERAAAQWALRAGRAEQAIPHLEAAAEGAGRLGLALERAFAFEALGERLRGRDRGRARSLLDGAERIWESMGLTREREREPERRRLSSADDSEDSSRATGPAHLRKLEALVEVGETLIAGQDLDAMLDRIVCVAMEVTGAERGFLLLYDEGEGPLRGLSPRVARAADGGRLAVESMVELQLSRAVLERIEEGGEATLIDDALGDPVLENAPSVQEGRLRSVLCAPLRTEEQRIGLLYLDSRLLKGLFTGRDRDLLSTFAAQAALAIHATRSREALRRANQELTETRAELIPIAMMSAVGQRAAVLSHETRTLLNISGGNLYMLP
ncbi:MAG: protein kinase domain-containing protein [Planctomycetota bacterium]